MAAFILGLDEWDVAMPPNNSWVKKFDPNSSPALLFFKITGTDLAVTPTKMFKPQYELVMAENKTYSGGNGELAKWNKILANFSTIIRFFPHYWCLKYDNDKEIKMMYEEACLLGKHKITEEKKGFSTVIKALLEEKIYDHWVQRMEGLIATRFLHDSMSVQMM